MVLFFEVLYLFIVLLLFSCNLLKNGWKLFLKSCKLEVIALEEVPYELVSVDTTPLLELVQEVLELGSLLLAEPLIFDDGAFGWITEVTDTLPVVLGHNEDNTVENLLPLALTLLELCFIFIVFLLGFGIDRLLDH